jgi:hypothetical protein
MSGEDNEEGKINEPNRNLLLTSLIEVWDDNGKLSKAR